MFNTNLIIRNLKITLGSQHDADARRALHSIERALEQICEAGNADLKTTAIVVMGNFIETKNGEQN